MISAETTTTTTTTTTNPDGSTTTTVQEQTTTDTDTRYETRDPNLIGPAGATGVIRRSDRREDRRD